MVCRSRDHLREQNNPNKRRVIERSIYSGHYCFAQNDYKSGYLNEVEWHSYNHAAKFFLQEQCHIPDGFIYLKADPQVCFERMQKRNRTGEEAVKLAYLEQIHQWHERFLIEKENLFEGLKHVPVLVLDANEDFLNTPEAMKQHMIALQEFMDQKPSTTSPQMSF